MAEVQLKSRIPMLRGKIHIGMMALYFVFIVLIVRYKLDLSLKLAFLVMLTCSLSNFSAVIVLHNCYWTQLNRSFLRRIDYAGIFLMIGGSGFPCCVYFMTKDWVVLLVIMHWTIILCGVFGSLLFNFTSTPKWFRSLVYVLTATPYLFMLHWLIAAKYYYIASFVVSTGTFYLIGSIVYAARWPNLVPGIFESHDLFHLFCSFGFISTSLMNYRFLGHVNT